MKASPDVDVCVVGAGPVGATLAARLASAGISTAVIDAAPLPTMEMPAFDGRAYAIALTSIMRAMAKRICEIFFLGRPSK
ncbi:MAG: hypothetical protein EBT34_15630, partial [Acetobacteraceae bacterium]|nr:hypothetical protein [Acetobacteraceae bacterium]